MTDQRRMPPFDSTSQQAGTRITRIDLASMSNEQVQKLVYELQLHRAELEAQNEELRKTQLELAQTRDEFRDLYDYAPVGYLTLDQKHTILRANFTAAQMLGTTQSELLQKSLGEFITRADRDACESNLTEAFRTRESSSQEFRLSGSSGSQLYVLLEAVPFEERNSGSLLCRVTLTDITRRAQTEQYLRESEESLRTITDAVPAIIARMDCQQRFTYVNRACADTFRLSQKEMLGRTIASVIGSENFLQVRPFLEQAIGGIPISHECELRLPGSDTTCIKSMTYVPHRSVDHEVIGLFVLAIDISAHKSTEAALVRARQAAESANQTKSEFLANISHEIRTPMTAILGYTDLMARHLTNPDDLNCVETIKRNGHFLLEIINDMLDISKLEAGRLELRQERFALAPLLANVQSLMAVRAREKGLDLTFEAAEKVPETIQSDPQRLQQILFNLTGNAIKFTEEGSVRVVMRVVPDEELLQFDIIDTGIGISPEIAERLFQPFSQGDSSHTFRHEGTGLGLCISHRLAELLGGGISFESQPQQGSTFTLSIQTGPLANVPLVGLEMQSAAAPTESTELPALELRVLVADDRREMRFFTQRIVEEAGGEVITAQNGKEVIEKFQEAERAGSPVDVVLMDMQMPVMDGYEATRQLRAMGFTRPIIGVSAHAMRGDHELSLAAGCTDYLTKPVEAQQLLATISRHCDQTQATAFDSPTASREPLRILLVEDGESARKIQAMALTARGHETYTAKDGASAIEVFRKIRPHVVLLDLGLPDMSGYDVLERLRQEPDSDQSMFIALSGRGEPEDIQRSQEAGFARHVVKPVGLDELERFFPAWIAQ